MHRPIRLIHPFSFDRPTVGYVDSNMVAKEGPLSIPARMLLALVLFSAVVIGGCDEEEITGPQSRITVSTTQLIFTAPAGGSNPPQQKLTIAQDASPYDPPRVSRGQSWVSLIVSSNLNPDTLFVSVSIAGLPVGEYVDTVLVEVQRTVNSPVAIEVRLIVTPSLTTSRSSVRFNALAGGGDPPAETLSVIAPGGGIGAVGVTNNAGWLNIAPTSGVVPLELSLSASVSGLASGEYRDTVRIVSTGLDSSATEFPVILGVSSWQTSSVLVSFDLADLWFVSADTGYAVGIAVGGIGQSSAGIIIETTDGGATWTTAQSVVPGGFESIAFSGLQVGWIVGDSGSMYTTVDRGATWVPVDRATLGVDSTINFFAVAFANALVGWAAGSDGTVIATTDGGASWTPQASGTNRIITDLHIISATEVWACGLGGVVSRTLNGGSSWQPRPSGTTDDFWGIAASDSGIVVLGSDGRVQFSQTDGATWTVVDMGTDVLLQDLVFASPQTGWLVGNNGTIYRTDDGGGTWVPQVLDATSLLAGVFARSTNLVWTVGENGVTARSQSGGF